MSRFYGDFDPASTATTTVITETVDSTVVSLYLPFEDDALDKSSYNHTVTTSGPITLDTAQAKFGSKSARFDGSSYLTISDNSVFDLNGTDFTIEMFVYFPDSVGQQAVISKWTGSGTDKSFIVMLRTDAGSYFYWTNDGTNNQQVQANDLISVGQWTHIAVTQTGSGAGSGRLFINGNVQSDTDDFSGIKNTSTNVIIGGRDGGTVSPFTGFIDDLRIIKGKSLYTTSFTVPTSPVGNSVSEVTSSVSNIRTHSHVWNYPDVYDARFADTWPVIDTGPTTFSHIVRFDASMSGVVDTAAGTWTSVTGTNHPTTLVNGTTATLLIADQNGLNVVRTNTSFVVTSADQVSTVTSAYSFAMVYSRNVTTSAQNIYPFGTGPGNNASTLAIEIHASNTGGADFDVAGGNSYDRTVSVAGADFKSADYTRYLIMASGNSGAGIHNVKVQVRGGTSSAVTLGTSGSNRSTSPRFLDSSFKTGAFSGAQQLDICEIIFYDVELSSADMITEADRLATKWGL